MNQVRVMADVESLHQAAARELIQRSLAAVNARGVFHVALSGGSTPRGLFSLLVTDGFLFQNMPWAETHFWWSDERHVPPDHPDSNYKMARDAMLTRAPIPPENIHRVHSEYADPARAAEEYQAELLAVIQSSRLDIPQFDLILLGMGPDGHTASLFPGTRALDEPSSLVVANWVGKFFTWRITFTPPLINRARAVLFLVTGEDKSLALKGVLEGSLEPRQLPAQLVQPASKELLWLVDQKAAAQLALQTLNR